MNKFLTKIGFIGEKELAKNDFKVKPKGLLYYPKAQLRYKDEIPNYNILLLLSDFLCADMLGDIIIISRIIKLKFPLW